MFFLRLAFWLTIVVLNLPRVDSPLPAQPKNATGSSASKPSKVAARSPCAQHKWVCDPPGLTIPFRGKTPNGVRGSHDERSQNTLRSSDLAPPGEGRIEIENDNEGYGRQLRGRRCTSANPVPAALPAPLLTFHLVVQPILLLGPTRSCGRGSEYLPATLDIARNARGIPYQGRSGHKATGVVAGSAAEKLIRSAGGCYRAISMPSRCG